MTWQKEPYFFIVLFAIIVTGLLAWFSWKQRSITGGRFYFWLALAMCVAALEEALSMLSPSQALALFWFNMRFVSFAAIPPLWLLFVLEYSGRRNWLSKGLVIALFAIPLITQIMLWTSSLHQLWVLQEVSFQQDGFIWVAEIASRVPGPWYLVHIFYTQLLLLAGSFLLLRTAWRKVRFYRLQALLLFASALVPVGILVLTTFNLLPPKAINPTLPGFALSALLAATAIFRFDFLKRSPAPHDGGLPQADASQRRLQAQLLLFFGVMLIVIIVAGYSSYWNFERDFRTQMEKQLTAIASLKNFDLEAWRAERMADAKVVAQNSAFTGLVQRYLENAGDEQAQAQLQSWLDALVNHYEYSSILFLDTGGVARLGSPAMPASMPEHTATDILAVVQSGQLTFLDFRRDDDEGKIHLGILVPIYVQQGDTQPLGVLVMEIDPEVYLWPYLMEWPVPSETSEALLVRREGEEVVFLNPLRFDPDAALNLRFPLSETKLLAVQAVLGRTGVTEGVDYRNQSVIGALQPVPGTPWLLVTRVDIAEVFAPLHERLWLIIAFYGMMVLSICVGLVLVWRQQRLHFFKAQAETAEALRSSEGKFRLAFNTSPDAFAITRISDGRFVTINQGFEKLTGYRREDVIGKSSLEINIWKDPRDLQIVLAGLQSQGEVRNYGAPFLTRSGEIYGLMSAAIIELDGEPHILNITRDITERNASEIAMQQLLKKIERDRTALLSTLEDKRRTEEAIRKLNETLEQRVQDRTVELEVSNKELEAFSYSISHDLRAPLRAMDGFSRILLEKYASSLDPEAGRYLNLVRDNAKQMGQLVDDLLAFSRLGRQALVRETVSPRALVDQALADLRAEQEGRHVEIIVGDLSMCAGDTALLKQVFVNLLSNALKFTCKREAARIEIGYLPHPSLPAQYINERGAGGEGAYFVRDNGVGFDMQYVDKLFGVFQRLHRAEEYEGTGVGLAIVQRIIHRHGGRVWAEAEVDKGATFYFTLGGVSND